MPTIEVYSGLRIFWSFQFWNILYDIYVCRFLTVILYLTYKSSAKHLLYDIIIFLQLYIKFGPNYNRVDIKASDSVGDIISRFLGGRRTQNTHYAVYRKYSDQLVNMEAKPIPKEVLLLRYKNLKFRTNKFYVEINLVKRSSMNAVRTRFILEFGKRIKLADARDLNITKVEKITNRHFILRFCISNFLVNFPRLNLCRQLTIFSRKCDIRCD